MTESAQCGVMTVRERFLIDYHNKTHPQFPWPAQPILLPGILKRCANRSYEIKFNMGKTMFITYRLKCGIYSQRFTGDYFRTCQIEMDIRFAKMHRLIPRI
jgi:hypothetical protein